MLVARFANGNQLSLTDRWKKDQLLSLKEQESFYCPTCQSPVIIKLGTKKQWHFAHEKESAICKHFERESDTHLEGKQQLYHWLIRRGNHVFLEHYLPSLKQRPDILYVKNNRQIALEYQCSPISLELHHKRTSTYVQNGIYPLWIIGANRLERVGGSEFTLQPFAWSSTFIIKSDLFPSVLYYCPKEKTLILLRNLIPITGKKAIATMSIRSLQDLSSFSDMFTMKNYVPMNKQWLYVKKHWRYACTPFPSNAQKFFNDYCYYLRVSPFLFPAEAGWPHEHSYWIETPLHIWQSWIYYEFIWQKPLHQVISFHQIYHSFKSKVQEKIFSVRVLPLVKGHYSFAIMHYLKLLTKFGVLHRKGKNEFVISNVVSELGTIEEAMTRDQVYRERILF